MTIEEAFSLKNHEVISLVGGGGKTTLMFALGKELSSEGRGIVVTTTTKIWESAPSPSFALFLSEKFSEMKKWVIDNLQKYSYLVIAQKKLNDGKLQGIVPQWVEEVDSFPGVSFVLVEGDGAAGRSLKAPREGEPVVPLNTSLLIPVVGIDALGCPLEEKHVFRSEMAARVLNMALGSTVTEAMIARLLEEILKVRPPNARVIPFINKVDLPGGLEKARRLASHLQRIEGVKIERVVLGQAQGHPVVKEIIPC